MEGRMIGKRPSSAALAAGLVGLAFCLAGCTATAAAGPPPPAVSGGCALDSSVACRGGGTGFSCAIGDIPSDADRSLACSVGVAGSDADLYCCVSFSSTTCAPDATVRGCAGYSFGFSCTGNDRPDETDSSLVCSDPVDGGNALLYCCTN
jgi:hypothetical protein